jgi:carboxymethylenebutenolidase
MRKTIDRILLGLLALLLILVLFLAGSIVVDTVSGRDRILAVTNTTLPGQNGQPDVRAFVARPPGEGPFPAVIMIHEFFGLNESIVGKANGLAEAGYLVVAPDTFRGSTTAWIPRAIFQTVTTPPERINADLDAAFAWLAGQPDADPARIAVLGFCYGGRASLAYSLHNPRVAATVIFYGSPVTDPRALETLTGPVLGIYGGADASIPLANVRAFDAALEQAGVPHEISVYEGQPHAFVTDIESIRQGGAQGDAWEQMLRFLDRALNPGAASRPSSQVTAQILPVDYAYYLRLAFEHAFLGIRHGHK